MTDLRFFDADEFGESWDVMSARLLVLLDVLRWQWGAAFHLSPHPRALARYDGRDDDSQHNVDRWGECRACDGFPAWILTRDDARRLVRLATRIGFTGIGIYPHWRFDARTRIAGVHLDSRTNRPVGEPALWGAVDDGNGQRYVGIDEAIGRIAA